MTCPVKTGRVLCSFLTEKGHEKLLREKFGSLALFEDKRAKTAPRKKMQSLLRFFQEKGTKTALRGFGQFRAFLRVKARKTLNTRFNNGHEALNE